MDGYGIKPLERTTIPRSHVILSVESRLGGDRAGYEQTWRCGATELDYVPRNGRRMTSRLAFSEAKTMWEAVSRHCGVRGLTFLWCHDLSWTSRVSAAFTWLPDLGWRLDAFSLIPGSGWLVWRKGRATLKFFDTMSVWQVSMDRLAALFGLGRKPLPATDARSESWESRVWQDMRILAQAVDSYRSWIKQADLGPLAVTGSGQAWAAFRRRHMTHGILVHNDPGLRAMEREAMWAGRAEAWWHGTILTQQVDEWDFTNAYTNIGWGSSVPVYPDRPVLPDTPVGPILEDERYALLAEVEIDTDVPCVPARYLDGIVWPTGVFATTLWEPEIRIAVESGAGVRIRRGWLYRCAPALFQWSDWIKRQLSRPDTDVPVWQKAILKRWGNTLVGRFGMRYPQWELIGTSSRVDAFAIPMWDMDSDETHLLMQAGYQMFEQTGTAEPRYSAPMVTGYVMSAMRAKLWRLMEAMPDGALLYVDTDSVLTTDAWRSHMSELAAMDAFEGLRLKRSWSGFAIYGPRQIVTGDEVRFSGLPKNAERTGRHDFEGEITESLEQALGHNALDRVRISRKRWRVEGKDVRRNGPATGWTKPHHLNLLEGNNA